MWLYDCGNVKWSNAWQFGNFRFLILLQVFEIVSTGDHNRAGNSPHSLKLVADVCSNVTNVPSVDLSVRMRTELRSVHSLQWNAQTAWSASERVWHLYVQSVERSRPQPTVGHVPVGRSSRNACIEQSAVKYTAVYVVYLVQRCFLRFYFRQ